MGMTEQPERSALGPGGRSPQSDGRSLMARLPVVLCVDDESTSLRLLNAILSPRGFDVVTTATGSDALAVLESREVDIVLLDVMLPEVSGFDICRRIKEDERRRHIPVVMVTALRSKDDRIRGIEAGADDFISKPFDQPELLARIGMLLKIKDLNDRLEFAYTAINDLISYGEEVVKCFDPLHFDFGATMEDIVRRILRRSNGESRQPEMIIVGLDDSQGIRRCRGYRNLEGVVRGVELDIKQCQCPRTACADGCISTIANREEFERPENRYLRHYFDSLGIEVSNLASYVSPNLCIHALNYDGGVGPYDTAVLNSLVMQTIFLHSLSDQVRDTDDAFAYTVRALVRAAEVNDEDTGNHILRVGEYSALLAHELGMSAKFTDLIRLQAQMHDVGKIHVPAAILRKPGRLDEEEFRVVKQHPEYGAKILGGHVRLTMARTIALTHHERWDGSGYPKGLRREDIPIEGRITNLADIYDALRNARSYKPAFSHETTLKIITEGDGRTLPQHFDPGLLDIFYKRADGFSEIYNKLHDRISSDRPEA